MKETLENKLDAGFKIYQDGDMFNVRELEVGMTLVYPKIVREKIRCNLKGFPKCVTDKILFKREQYDGLKWQLHLKGMKAEYIFELFDTSENAFDSDKSLLIRTQLVKKGNKTVKEHLKFITDPRVSSSQYGCSHSELAHSPIALSASGSSIPAR